MSVNGPFSSLEAVRFGWTKTRERLGPFLILGAIAALLGLVQRAYRGPGAPQALVSFVAEILGLCVSMVLVRFALRVHDGLPLEPATLGALLEGFPSYLLTMIFQGLVVCLGLVLLIVPGVIWGLELAFSGFAVVDGRRRTLEAMRESRRLTRGIKGRLFWFALLLLGVNLLGALAFGVGLLLSVPTSAVASAYVFRRLQLRAKAPEVSPAPAARASSPLVTRGLWFTALVCFAGTACAPGPNVLARVPDARGDVAGFWLGLWHGLIVPVTFLISLFTKRVGIYELHNVGGWYDFGFVLGLVVAARVASGPPGAWGGRRGSARTRSPRG